MNANNETLEYLIRKNLIPIEEHKLSKKLWLWLAETGSEIKENWPGWQNIEKRPVLLCFYCERAFNKKLKGPLFNCASCNLQKISGAEIDDPCLNGLFHIWITASQNVNERKETAKKIYELHLELDKYYE